MNRRLPVYLLLDCSESMAGEAFDAVVSGIGALAGELRRDPQALETACVSVITFSSVARQVMPLTDLMNFKLPRLRLGSGTALGGALRLWQQCMAQEVLKTSATQKGDYKPVCFIMTDGEPTDAWEVAADQVRTSVAGKKANVIAVACGKDADVAKLRRITETVLLMKDANAGAFAQFFKWVSASVSTASQKLEQGGGRGLGLPKPPEGVEIASATEGPLPGGAADRQIFLHTRCTKTKGFYLIRYIKNSEGQGGSGKRMSLVYRAVAAHKVEDFEFEAEGESPKLKVSNENLVGCPACPYCGNGLWGMCPNGHVHCCPEYSGSITLTCPWCGVTCSYSPNRFDVGRGVG